MAWGSGALAPVASMANKPKLSASGDGPADLQRFLAVSSAVFWSTDAEGRVIFADAGLAQRLGMPPRFDTSDAHLALIHPEDLGAVAVEARQARDSGELLDTECRARLTDRPDRWIRVRARFDRTDQRWFGSVEDVHERREAQAAVYVANQRLALALDGSDAWAWNLDVQTGSVWYSDRWRAVLGYEAGDIAHDGSDFDTLTHPDDRAEVSLALQAHLAGDTAIYEAEYRVRKKDGGWLWVQDRGRVVERDAAGLPLRAIGTRGDISARKAAEVLAHAQQAYLETLLDNITDSVVAVDPDGRRGFYNNAYARLFLGEVRGKVWEDFNQLYGGFDVFDADGAPIADEQRPVRRILRGETISETEIHATVRATGRRYCLIYNGQPVRDAVGRVELAVITMRDVTEQQRTLAALAASEARLHAIIESLDEGVVAYAPGEDSARFANSAFQRLFAPPGQPTPTFATPEEAFETYDLSDAAGHVLTLAERPVIRLLRGERVDHLPLRVRFRDGRELDVVYRGEPVFDADGNVKLAVLAVRDVTQQLRAEADLATLQQELIHVSRVSALGTMAGSLAHELNQPLTAVANYATAARMMLAEPEAIDKAREALGHVATEALRAGQIVNRLRRFITKGEVERQPVSLDGIVREALAIAHHDAASHGLLIKMKLDPSVDAAIADRIQLQQVIFNLVRNAVEAMSGQAAGELTIGSRPAGDNVELLIADRGPGLPLEVEKHLFEPFITTKEGGMGIGLPICRSIMRAHDGDIRAERRPGGGTVFILTLPRATRGIAAE